MHWHERSGALRLPAAGRFGRSRGFAPDTSGRSV